MPVLGAAVRLLARTPELAVALAVASALLWGFSDYVADDALISLRYARHLAAGEGLRWNPGQAPVEGYSNFTHVGLGALAVLARVPPLDVLRVVNQLAALAIVVLVHVHARRLGAGRLAAGGAALVIAAHPALAYWANSGLETALYAALLLAGALSLERPRTVTTAGLWLAAAFTRPEGAAIVAALPLGLYAQRWLGQDGDHACARATWREHGRWLVAFAVVYAAWFAWRWHTFGHPWPNSVYYKAEVSRGGILAREFLEQTLPVVVLAALVPVRRLTASGSALLSIPLVYALVLYEAADSVAQLHRFFLPALPCLVVLAALTVEHRVRVRGRLAVVLVWLALAAWTLRHERSGLVAARDDVARLAERARVRVAVAGWIDRELGPQASVAIGDVGTVGYLLDNPVHDLFGLNDPAFVHEYARKRKRYVRAVMRRRPDVVVLVSRDPERFVERWATDRHVLESPGFAAHYPLAHRVTSRAERYHYRIHVRDGSPDRVGEERRGGGSPAVLIRRARAAIELRHP